MQRGRRHLSLISLGLGAFGLGGQLASAHPTVLMDKDGHKFYLTGFAELDAIKDSTRSLTEVMGSNPVSITGAADGSGDSGRTQYSARNSRIAFGFETARHDEVKGKGYLEFDLFGYEPAPGAGVTEGGYYQNAALRVRHAYLKADHDNWAFLAGQTWSLFGWQADYVLSTLSVTPVTGTVFQRTPQFMFLKHFGLPNHGHIQSAIAFSRPVQRESSMPNIDFGVRVKLGERVAPYTSASGDVHGEQLSLGISGTYRQLEYQNTAALTNQVRMGTFGWAANLMVPILAMGHHGGGEKHEGGHEHHEKAENTLALVAEMTGGSGYGDMFPGWSGNVANPAGTAGVAGKTPNQPNIDPGIAGYDATTGKLTAIQLSSMNAALQYHLPTGCTWVTLGMGQLSSSNVKKLTAAAASATSSKVIYDKTSIMFANVVHDFNREMRMGLEFSNYSTHYLSGKTGTNTRYQLSTWYRF